MSLDLSSPKPGPGSLGVRGGPWDLAPDSPSLCRGGGSGTPRFPGLLGLRCAGHSAKLASRCAQSSPSRVRLWVDPAAGWGSFWALDSSAIPSFLNTQKHYCTDHLHDSAAVGLLVVGFTLLVPLLVLALAAYCRLARRLQLSYCLVPYSKAIYKNLPASRYHSVGCCGCCSQGLDAAGEKVWV